MATLGTANHYITILISAKSLCCDVYMTAVLNETLKVQQTATLQLRARVRLLGYSFQQIIHLYIKLI